MRKFTDLFKFDPAKAFFVGVEREAFLVDTHERISPAAPIVLGPGKPDFSFGSGESWPEPLDSKKFGYELSACQIESRVGPCKLIELSSELKYSEELLRRRTEREGYKTLYTEVGPENMPLDVYPDPSGRYQEIVKTMPRHILLAACRVIGTHIHIGMPDLDTAIRVYNHVIQKYDWLCAKGNGSFGDRLDIYRTVAPNCDPKPYADWKEFHTVAAEQGFDKDPRKCWTLIRISKHGTIEFRMFGATSSIPRIVEWATICHDLCKEAMK